MRIAEQELTREHVRLSSRVFVTDAFGRYALLKDDHRLGPLMDGGQPAPMRSPYLEIEVSTLNRAAFNRVRAALVDLGIDPQFLEPWIDLDQPKS